ncbi:MAG: ribonucleotide reductase N-terminal alpha domain-containing protein [Candidatus Micrarchaeia archaeon]
MTERTLKFIRKRDGRIVPFDQEKITNAIFKAAQAVGGKDRELAQKLSDQVVEELEKKYDGRETPGVEDIQDIVEKVLIENGHARTAKAYILYRQKHKELRELRELVFGRPVTTKLSINALKVLKERYLRRDSEGNVIETPDEMFRRVAKNIAQADRLSDENADLAAAEEEFYQAMANLEFLPNSPTLMNAGNEIQQLSACFVIPVGDSIEEIFDSIKHTAMIHKSGGGTGFSFSRLRPKNDVVMSTRGVSSGPVSFMKVFDSATEAIKQGGKRRGANMAILRVDHPDILEFITAKQNEGVLTNFNISVAATEKFMQAVLANQDYELINPRNGQPVKRLNAREVFSLIVTMAWRTGDPGMIFLDRINEDNPTPSVGQIEATNPCVSGNALVSTDRGLVRMEELADTEEVSVAVDARTQPASVGLQTQLQHGVRLLRMQKAWKTGKKSVVRLTTHAGFELTATPDHRVLTPEGWRRIEELVPGKSRVFIQSGAGFFNSDARLPVMTNSEIRGANGRLYHPNFPREWSAELGQVLGWLVGDGWLREGKNARVGFTFSEADLPVLALLKPVIDGYYGRPVKAVKRANGVIHLSYHSKFFVDFFNSLGVKLGDADEKEVPASLFKATRDAVVGFLQALFTADGTINIVPEKSAYIRLTSKSRRLLQGVQLLLLNLGIFSRIYDRSRSPHACFAYTTKRGEKRNYVSDGVCFELEISKDAVPLFLERVGFMRGIHSEKVKQLGSKDYYSTRFEDTVAFIEPQGSKEVFDLSEPITRSFIANGIVVHNCGEQPLLPYESCNLGSINLAKCVKETNGRKEIDWEKLRRLVRTAVHFLDNVIDMNRYPLSQIEDMTKANRKIGLGIMGFADLLVQLWLPYDSEEAEGLAEKIMAFIEKEAVAYDRELAAIRGPFPNFKDSIYAKKGEPPRRNATVTTIAPTGTISMIADCSSGIEPLFAISYIKRVMDGKDLLYVNEYFEKIAKEKGFYSDELMRKIAAKGSIQHIEGIPDDVKRVFVTAHDISPEWHVRIQAAFQRYTENAVSKTINFAADATVKDVEDAYLLAYKLRCKGITIYRDRSKAEQVLHIPAALPTRKVVVTEGGLKAGVTEEAGTREEDVCPVCGAKLYFSEGCATCVQCGTSMCKA